MCVSKYIRTYIHTRRGKSPSEREAFPGRQKSCVLYAIQSNPLKSCLKSGGLSHHSISLVPIKPSLAEKGRFKRVRLSVSTDRLPHTLTHTQRVLFFRKRNSNSSRVMRYTKTFLDWLNWTRPRFSRSAKKSTDSRRSRASYRLAHTHTWTRERFRRRPINWAIDTHHSQSRGGKPCLCTYLPNAVKERQEIKRNKEESIFYLIC